MEAQSWLEHPDVKRMVELAVSRRRHLFEKFHDIDVESLVADIWGALASSKYDPTKRKPGSHAYQVAWSRLTDLRRRLNHRLESNPMDPGEAGEAHRERAIDDMDDPETELAGMIRRYYSLTLSVNVPLRIGPGRPTLTFAQKAAITWLMKHMRWTCRDAEMITRQFPGILAAIDVTESRSRQFFSSASRLVTKLMKNQKSIISAPAA